MANEAKAIKIFFLPFAGVELQSKAENNEEEEMNERADELKCCALFDDNCSIENLSFRTFSTNFMSCLQIFFILLCMCSISSAGW